MRRAGWLGAACAAGCDESGARQRGRGGKWELDGKSRALISPGALRADAAILEFDEVAGDGESEPEPAEAARAGVFLLDEGLEDIAQHLRLDADARVGDLDEQRFFIFCRVARAHGDDAAGRGEFHGVLEHVPENLLHAHDIGFDGMLWRGKVERDLDLPLLRFAAEGVASVTQRGVGVEWMKIEAQLAAGDARDIEQIIDELRLECDGLANNLDVTSHTWRQLGVISERGGEEQCGIERCAQLVRKRGEELVLGPRGRLGALPGRVGADPRGFRAFEMHAGLRLALAQRFLRLLALGDVVKAIDCSRDFSSFVLQRTDIHDDGNPRAVGPLDEHFRVTRGRYFARDHLGHGTLLVGHKTAVRTEQFERATKPLVGIP